jgi:CheY-like chemotaxis protein
MDGSLRTSILLVEDSDDLRESTREILLSMGHELTTAVNAEQAIELFQSRKGKIDLLLTDIIMPGMDGKQLADLLRSDEPDLRVLFVSGYTNDVILDRGVDEHYANFLAKPFSAETLANKLQLILAAPPSSKVAA